MKKNLLLMMLCCPIVLAAQNGVTVSNLAVSVGSPTTVTFNVSWQTPMPVALWSDTVWVFVDYNNAGKMERLPLLPGATLTATSSGGKVIEEPDNNKGVWVAGNVRNAGSFSATVKLLTAVKDIGGACVYGSNYPPVGEYSSSDASKMVFTGTPEYDVALLHESGSLITQTTSSPLNIPAGFTVQSFTDKTAAPGKLSCIPSTVYDLTASALSFCAGGAGVTFSLSGTESGRIYQLYKDGTTVVSTLTGDGNAATFCEAVSEVGTYTARAAALPEYCPAVMTGSHAVASVPSPAPPTMSGSSSYCSSGTITATPGNGGDGIRWDNGTTDALRTITVTGTYRAVTTSANGCTSSEATVAVNIRQAGTAGQAIDDVCGCASGLLVCEGACSVSCPIVLPCGLTDVSTLAYDGYENRFNAGMVCVNKHMRLPLRAELECLGDNPTAATGTLLNAHYWTGVCVPYEDESNNYTVTSVNPITHTQTNYFGNLGGYHYFKCVK
jgi:hypothetical protein